MFAIILLLTSAYNDKACQPIEVPPLPLTVLPDEINPNIWRPCDQQRYLFRRCCD